MVILETAQRERTCRKGDGIGCGKPILKGSKCLSFSALGPGRFKTRDNLCLKCVLRIAVQEFPKEIEKALTGSMMGAIHGSKR